MEFTKPVIAAIEGPAVAGGMELAVMCDMRVMAEDAYMGAYCRRWGVPLIDGGTIRIPRLVGQGKALDLVLTGRKVEARECYEIGLCERVVPTGETRETAEKIAHDIARFPRSTMLADRKSVIEGHGMTVRDGMKLRYRTDLAQGRDMESAARDLLPLARESNWWTSETRPLPSRAAGRASDARSPWASPKEEHDSLYSTSTSTR